MINYESPCLSLCELDETGEYCVACKRTQEEIFSWLSYDEVTRQKLNKEIKKRKLS